MATIKKDYYQLNESVSILQASKADIFASMLSNNLLFYVNVGNVPIVTGEYKYNTAPPENCGFGKILLNMYMADNPSWHHLLDNTYVNLSTIDRHIKIARFDIPHFMVEHINVENISYEGEIKPKLLYKKDYNIHCGELFSGYIPNKNGHIVLITNLEDSYIRVTPNINIDNINIALASDYYVAPKDLLNKIRNSVKNKFPLEYIFNDGTKFILVAESKIHSLPLIGIDDLYINHETLQLLRDVLKNTQLEESAFRRQAAQMDKINIALGGLVIKHGDRHTKNGANHKIGDINISKTAEDLHTFVMKDKNFATLRSSDHIKIGFSEESLKTMLENALKKCISVTDTA